MSRLAHILLRQDAATTAAPTTTVPRTTTQLAQNPAASTTPHTSDNATNAADTRQGNVSLTTRLAFVGVILLTMLLIISLRRTRIWRRARHLLYTRLLGRDPPATTSNERHRANGAGWPRVAPEAPADLLPMPELQERESLPHDAPDACLICLDDLDTQPVAAGPCGHWAHSECLKLWLAKDAARTCPACRQPMVGPAAPVPSSVAATAASASAVDSGEAVDAASRTAVPDAFASTATVLRVAHGHAHSHGYLPASGTSAVPAGASSRTAHG